MTIGLNQVLEAADVKGKQLVVTGGTARFARDTALALEGVIVEVRDGEALVGRLTMGMVRVAPQVLTWTELPPEATETKKKKNHDKVVVVEDLTVPQDEPTLASGPIVPDA